MSLRFACSNDFLSSETHLGELWDSVVDFTSPTNGLFGGRALAGPSSGDYITIDFATVGYVWIVHFWMRTDEDGGNSGYGNGFLQFRSGNGGVDASTDIQCGLGYSRRDEKLFFNLGTTLHKKSARLSLRKGWHHIQVRVFINGVGSYEVKVNDQTVITGSGVDTDSVSGETGVKRIQFRGVAATGEGYDSIVIFDNGGSVNNTFGGMLHTWRSVPDGDGNQNDFTRSTGVANYPNVDDDTPDDDSSYNHTSTDGHIDLYDFDDPSPLEDIRGLVAFARARNTAGGNAELALRCRSSGGTEVNGGKGYQAITSSYAYYWDVFEDEPGGSGWTPAQVNGAETGLEANFP